MFAEVDRDGSGYITYDELQTIIRQHLRKGPKVLSDNAIKALWCAIDADCSNAVQKDEMAAFFKRGGRGGGEREGKFPCKDAVRPGGGYPGGAVCRAD